MFDSTSKMIAAQLGPKIQKMFFKGMSNFAKSKGISIERAQLMLQIPDVEKGIDGISYTYCIDWKTEQQTDIKTALDISIDILGLCSLIPPAIGSVMQENADKFQFPLNEMKCFLYTVEDSQNVGVAIYHGNVRKRICTIGELFSIDDE